jgi:hypothetical protein
MDSTNSFQTKWHLSISGTSWVNILLFYSNKKFFFVAGKGLTNTTKSSVSPNKSPTRANSQPYETSSPEIFTFIQNSWAGGCKIICQYDKPTIISSKGQTETLNVREWFTTNIIGASTNPALEPAPTQQNVWTGTPRNWPKVAVQQEENKRLIDINKKINDNSTEDAADWGTKWKTYASKELAAWAEWFEQENNSCWQQPTRWLKTMREWTPISNRKMSWSKLAATLKNNNTSWCKANSRTNSNSKPDHGLQPVHRTNGVCPAAR